MNTHFGEQDTETYQKALRAFRQRRHIKRLRSVVQAAAVVLIVTFYIITSQKPASKQTEFVSAPPSIPVQEAPHSLTDQELIAKFPPGSCFMAEVNGKKILVFKDPAVEKQFFQ